MTITYLLPLTEEQANRLLDILLAFHPIDSQDEAVTEAIAENLRALKEGTPV